MPSPIVDCVREIPLIVEKDYPMEVDTGFPFDDDREENNANFRTQLDDIAARHPEFAHHLGSFPFRSSSRTRSNIPEEFTQQRFTERPFTDRFERFGFPFDEEPFREEQTPYYQRYPHYYPHEHPEDQGEQSSNVQKPETAESEVNKEPVEQEEAGRSRKLKNIQQSNTVDLGQRQEPVDDRNQRSMSAPPSNNRPRFVSSINIPVNQPKETSNVPPTMPQPSAPPQPQERVIPIHVEGRDEPIIPKKSSTSTSQPQPQQSQPYTEKFFTQRSPNFMNREQNFRNDWFPKTFQNKQPQSSQRGRSPQPQTKPESAQQPTNVPEQAECAQSAEAQPKPSRRPDPIDQIKLIQKDVSQLMAEVDKFAGKPRDKKYLYLDEMLTRNLIKLDDIDTQGQENIRLARKEAIKCIQKCISILESKAHSNAAEEEKRRNGESEENKPKEMGVEQTEQKDVKETTEKNKSMDVEKTSNEGESAASEKMEVESEKQEKVIEQPKEESKETSVEKMEVSEVTAGDQEKGEASLDTKKEETVTENTTEPKKESETTNNENETRTEVKDANTEDKIKEKA